MTVNAKSILIRSLIGWLPYLGVAWAYDRLSDGEDFWMALGVLLAVRLFFALLEGLAGYVAWHLHDKRHLQRYFIDYFRKYDFPPRAWRLDDARDYLARLQDNPSYADKSKYHAELPLAAATMTGSIVALEQSGIIRAMRFNAALDAALQTYSPRERAPEYVDEKSTDEEAEQ